MDPGGHPAYLRQEHPEVDTGLLQTAEPASHLPPVRVLHQHGQDVVTEVAAQLLR
ncbi:hypothetical protein [Streptomyces sp. BF23-19]|uniref:hypothetical protein n=1 Tax=unclassified Streptomyces TaxID=2593676 RepID=UPI0034E4331D